MPFLDKVKEQLLSRSVEVCVAAMTVLLAWAFTAVAPSLWRVISEEMPAQSILPVLLLSLLMNLILMVVLWVTLRKQKPSHQLKYGVLWDNERNPCCTKCKGPVTFGDWHYTGGSYYCRPCDIIHELKDAEGNRKTPQEALAEL